MSLTTQCLASMKRYYLDILIVFVSYYITAKLGLKVDPVAGFATLVWAPAGIALAGCLIFGIRIWPAIFAAAMLSNWTQGLPILNSALIGIGNTLEPVSAAYILSRFSFQRSCERPRDAFLLILVGAILTPAIAASIGTLSLYSASLIDWEQIMLAWRSWYLGDGFGAFIVGSFILGWTIHRAKLKMSFSKWTEAFALLSLFGIFCYFGFATESFRHSIFLKRYLVFPLLLWTALRFRVRGVVTANLILAFFAIWGSYSGYLFHPDFSPHENVALMQIFSFVSATTALILACLEHQRAIGKDAFIETNQKLKKQNADRQFLVDAGLTLSSSLDYRKTLKSLAHSAVHYLCDWCLIDILTEDRKIDRIAVNHWDLEKSKVGLNLLTKYPPRENAPVGASKVIRTGEAELGVLVDDHVLQKVAHSEDHFRMLKALNLKSYICVPLQIHDRIFGAMTLISAESGKIYGASDLALAKELAERASIAIEHAHLYDQVQDAVLARDEFISIASHELRTPLTPLQLQLQLLARHFQKAQAADPNAKPSDSILDALKVCEKQTQRLTRLVNELMDITRVRTGRLELQITETSLVDIVHDVTLRFQAEAAKSGIQILVKAEGSVKGFWDSSRMEQVVTNLISNAIKYGSQKPIEVEVLQSGGSAILTVQDHGIGIPRDQQHKIFERFERVRSSKRIAGLGLGLYICREIVEAHGGQIYVVSELGQGSKFTVRLPAEAKTQSTPTTFYRMAAN